jgi:hypothetical protein
VRVEGAEGDGVVTAEAEKLVHWDTFLDEASRNNVLMFRRLEWPQIKVALRKDYGIVLPEGLEPCWVVPGKARFWAQQVVRRSVKSGERTMANGQKKDIREFQDFAGEWELTSVLPANNASQIATRLRKGNLLRHPDQVIVEVEPPVSPEEPAETIPVDQFFCLRHGDLRGFHHWKGYVTHCRFYKESIEEKMPDEVLARAAKFKFYCQAHDAGFQDKRAANRHIREEMRQPGKAYHATVDEMNMAAPVAVEKKQEKENGIP